MAFLRIAASAVIALVFYLVPCGAVAVGRKGNMVIHKKVRRSTLLLQQRKSPTGVELLQGTSGGYGAVGEGTELLQQLAQAAPATAAELATSAKVVLTGVTDAHLETEKALHNSDAERDMLETQLLANGESLHVIKKLAESVSKMKAHVDSLESHMRKCNKKLADTKASEEQRTADTIAANTVQA